MKSLITEVGIFGPFHDIGVLADRYQADGIDYQLAVVGTATIETYVAPPPQIAPAAVPASVSMRQARQALLNAGLYAAVNGAISAMTGTAGDSARIEWEYATEIRRDHPLVATLAPALNLSSAQIDGLFVAAAGL